MSFIGPNLRHADFFVIKLHKKETVIHISTGEQCGLFCIESGEKENDQCDCRVVGGGV